MEETLICARCGKQAPKNSSFQKYCHECGAFEKKEKARVWRKTHPTEYRQRPKKLPKAEPPAKPQPDLSDWRNLEGKSLNRVDAEAKAFGLSYGQYTAAVRAGQIDTLLRDRGISDPGKILEEIKIR